MREQKLPYCYSYFSIASNGDLVAVNPQEAVFQAASGSLFVPQDITAMLGITPFRAFAADEVRANGSVYGFSRWNGCLCETPSNDAGEQCLAVVRQLQDKIGILNEIRRRYAVNFTLQVVAYSAESGATPAVYFPHEVIAFCHLSGTEIDVDSYVSV